MKSQKGIHRYRGSVRITYHPDSCYNRVSRDVLFHPTSLHTAGPAEINIRWQVQMNLRRYKSTNQSLPTSHSLRTQLSQAKVGIDFIFGGVLLNVLNRFGLKYCVVEFDQLRQAFSTSLDVTTSWTYAYPSCH